MRPVNPAAIPQTLNQWITQASVLAEILNSEQIDAATEEMANLPNGAVSTLPNCLLLSLLSHNTAMPSGLATLKMVERTQSELSVMVSRSQNTSDPQRTLICTLTVSLRTTESNMMEAEFDEGAAWTPNKSKR